MATYEAAALINNWPIAEEAAAELRVLATDLLLFARMKSPADESRGDRG